MSSNSLANNNAVRLGAAALVGGLVVYLIWASTSSSSTPRPPPSSSTSKKSTKTTTTITTITTSASGTSSSETEEKSSSKISDSNSQVESRSRQSVDIERLGSQKSGNTLTTAPTIPEGEEEDEDKKNEEQEDKEVGEVVVVERSIDREIITHDIEHAKKETELIQGKEVNVSEVLEITSAQGILLQSSTESSEENNQESIEVSENVKSESNESQVYQAHNTEQPIKDSVQVEEDIVEDTREREIGTSTVQISNVVQHEEVTEEVYESIEEQSSSISSASNNTEVSIMAASSESVLSSAVDVDHAETQAKETTKSRTSHLNTNAAVFTPSWMPAPVADLESQSYVEGTDPSYEWSSFENGEASSQIYEQGATMESSRVKMKSRCRFWPNCTNKACKFTHPTQYCRDPDNCSFGSRCNFIHPKDLTRKPSKSNSKLTLSRKESRRQYQTSSDSMSSSIESLDFAPQPVAVTNGEHS